MKNKIDLTVALPLWDMKNISWLQLESLCRQKTKYFWELIVCEEQSENFTGKDVIMSYEKRLKEAGCESIIYVPIYNRIPLSQKWSMIAKQASGLSYILAAGDDYSSNDRIELTHSKILEGYDWFDVRKSLFLDLKTFKTGTYDHSLKPARQSSVWIGTKTDFIRQLIGPPWPVSCIDNWIKNQTSNRISKYYRHTEELNGLCTDGANKISSKTARGSLYKEGYSVPFIQSTQKVEEILPLEIITKLKHQFLKP